MCYNMVYLELRRNLHLFPGIACHVGQHRKCSRVGWLLHSQKWDTSAGLSMSPQTQTQRQNSSTKGALPSSLNAEYTADLTHPPPQAGRQAQLCHS